MKKILLGALATGLFLSTAVQAADKVVVVPLNIPSDYDSFYVTLDTDQEEKTIATYGSLRYFVRCTINEDVGGGNFMDKVEILSTSTEAPWYDEQSPATAQVADDEVVVYDTLAPTGTEYYNNEIDSGSLVGPGGYYMSIDGESLGLGLNIYGHACTAVGSVLKVKKK